MQNVIGNIPSNFDEFDSLKKDQWNIIRFNGELEHGRNLDPWPMLNTKIKVRVTGISEEIIGEVQEVHEATRHVIRYDFFNVNNTEKAAISIRDIYAWMSV